MAILLYPHRGSGQHGLCGSGRDLCARPSRKTLPAHFMIKAWKMVSRWGWSPFWTLCGLLLGLRSHSQT